MPAGGPIRSGLIFLARIALGVILIGHAWMKFFTDGISATAENFESMGVPAATVAAAAAGSAELGSGILIVLGLFTPVAAVIAVGTMVGAWWFDSRGSGLFVTDGGWELVLAIGTASALLVVTGGGQYSVDRLIAHRRSSPATGASRTIGDTISM